MSTSFENSFSYFETITSNGFLSIYPPGQKLCKYTKPLPVDGSRIFDFPSFAEFENAFYQFLLQLADEDFGLKDFMYLMNKFSSEMSAQSFYDFYTSLYYKSSSLENDICVAVLGSTLDTAWEKKAYIKDISAPQEALDTFIFLNDSGTIYTILGTKRKSPVVKVTFSGERFVDVLEIGLFGSVICGEHLEAHEKAQMNSNWFQYLKNRDETGRDFMKLDEKQVSANIRGLLEELGFQPDSNFTPYLVGKDVIPGRDARYWTFGDSNQYGYKRPSASTMVAFVGNCKAPELADPLDLYECSKGTVVELDYALREFTEVGKLRCAFPSHSRMLQNVTKMLPDLFN